MNVNQELQSDLSQFLSECPLFMGLDSGQLNEVARLLEQSNYTAGDIIIAQEGAGDCLYIVQQGQPNIIAKNADGEEMHLSSAIVGETIALI